MSDTPDPEEKCLVCGTSRINHGDLNHRFSTDGQLITIKEEVKEPGMKAPRLRPENADRDQVIDDLAKSMEINAVMRLTEVLINKGILSGTDTLYIFSGHRATPPSS